MKREEFIKNLRARAVRKKMDYTDYLEHVIMSMCPDLFSEPKKRVKKDAPLPGQLSMFDKDNTNL